MSRPSLARCLLLMVVVAGTHACAWQADPPPNAGSPPSRAARPTSKVLTMAVQREPIMLHPDLTPGLVGGGGIQNLYLMVQNTLIVQDERYHYVPQLAVEQISPERGTWRINEDGTMRTAWRIRPNVRWHDGTPFTASDLLFSFQVYRDPAIPNRGRAAGLDLAESATAPDPHTLVINWASAFAYADRAEGLIPLPQHLLEDVFRNEKAELLDSRLLTTQFVGLGPYRVVTWEPATRLELARFDDYFLGRPAFDAVIVQFIADQNAVVASILAGSVDVVPGGVLGLEAAFGIQDQQERTGSRVDFVTTPSFRQLDFQHRVELAHPRNGVTNRLVRQALYYSIDRQTMTDTLNRGVAPIADSLIPVNHELRPHVESAIPQFPHNPTRAQQLLAEAGWLRESDGILVHQLSRERFELELRVNQGADVQQVQSIVAHDWRAVGVEAQLHALPPALATDREYRARMPGTIIFNHPADRYYARGDLHSRNIPSAEDRWAGGNRANYVNPRADALIDQLSLRITLRDRVPLLRELMQEVIGDVALLPLYWAVDPIVADSRIRGIRGASTWNVFEWARE